MGAFNLLITRLECPRCRETSEMEIELFFGEKRLYRYHLGDHYHWLPRKDSSNGGRPENGTMMGEGYAVCPVCQKDFFLKITTTKDILEKAEPNPGKPPYIP